MKLSHSLITPLAIASALLAGSVHAQVLGGGLGGTIGGAAHGGLLSGPAGLDGRMLGTGSLRSRLHTDRATLIERPARESRRRAIAPTNATAALAVAGEAAGELSSNARPFATEATEQSPAPTEESAAGTDRSLLVGNAAGQLTSAAEAATTVTSQNTDRAPAQQGSTSPSPLADISLDSNAEAQADGRAETAVDDQPDQPPRAHANASASASVAASTDARLHADRTDRAEGAEGGERSEQ